MPPATPPAAWRASRQGTDLRPGALRPGPTAFETRPRGTALGRARGPTGPTGGGPGRPHDGAPVRLPSGAHPTAHPLRNAASLKPCHIIGDTKIDRRNRRGHSAQVHRAKHRTRR
ncbi:hypothetical protein GCM10010319_54250 [Streptomyces blastmyceticus]|uniref:Uncharacterized protein n=1 Tax=Streptomyces blastmyceticus TaxID=68180 RepID=A0ABP3HH03_9ACTN